LVVGLHAHNNNHAHTILQLFLDSIAIHGVPSRVRGDHGIENVLMASWMEENCGQDRGSYIWGWLAAAIHSIRDLEKQMSLYTSCRSIHNTRIERLWYDVMQGFGNKWKIFFMDLEATDELNVSNPAHIWLLHHLFLPAINEDALEWEENWNNHKMNIRGAHDQTPNEMFLFSMLTDGFHGMTIPTNSQATRESSRRSQNQHSTNPFAHFVPELSTVVCEPPNPP
jgi:hypothetical protein